MGRVLGAQAVAGCHRQTKCDTGATGGGHYWGGEQPVASRGNAVTPWAQARVWRPRAIRAIISHNAYQSGHGAAVHRVNGQSDVAIGQALAAITHVKCSHMVKLCLSWSLESIVASTAALSPFQAPCPGSWRDSDKS